MLTAIMLVGAAACSRDDGGGPAPTTPTDAVAPSPSATPDTSPTTATVGAPQRVEPRDAPYSFADAVREQVTVLSARDDDGNGRPDPYVLDIIRPKDATDVPVILEQSPYWDGLGRGIQRETREWDSNNVITKMPLWYDNWFVPQGYAFVAMDAAGTGQSGGCYDDLGLSSQAAAVAALDFLSGAADGQNDQGAPVTATWSSGSVAMVGKSADAHHALSAAVTGHPALKAVVSIGSVTSSAERVSAGGIVDLPWPIESPGACSAFSEEHNAAIGDGRSPDKVSLETDILVNLEDYHAATLLAQGLRDLNTRSNAALALWDELGTRGVDRRLWLHQGGHTDPFDIRPREWVDAVDAFLNQHLRGGPAPSAPPVELQQPDLSWVSLDELPAPTEQPTFVLDGGSLVRGPGLDASASEPIATVASWEAFDGLSDPGPIDVSLYAAGTSEHHVAFDTEPLAEETLLSGIPEVELRVRASGPPHGIRAALVVRGPGEHTDLDAALYGTDVETDTVTYWGGQSSLDDGCYPGSGLARVDSDLDVVAVGQRGIGRSSWTQTWVDPGPGWVTVSFPLTRVQTAVPAGHRIALVLLVNDPVMLGRGVGSTVEVAAGAVTLPLG